jgi:hypothetical protein
MSMMRNSVRWLALAVACTIAAGLSTLYLGGLIVIGAGTFADVVLLLVPFLSFPIAIAAWWKPWTSVIAWTILIVVYFGFQIWLRWPHISELPENHTHLPWFTLVYLLLITNALLCRSGKVKPIT